MSMLNDRDRDLLKDLERRLNQEDPVWARQFRDFKSPGRARRDALLGTVIGLLVFLAVLFLLVGATVGAIVFGIAALTVAYVLYRL
jgi:uncharacterized membrane protein YccC